MKQGKKRASSEIQDVGNSGNFYKLVLVPRYKKKKKETNKKSGTGTTLIGTGTSQGKPDSTLLVPVPYLLIPVPPCVNGPFEGFFSQNFEPFHTSPPQLLYKRNPNLISPLTKANPRSNVPPGVSISLTQGIHNSSHVENESTRPVVVSAPHLLESNLIEFSLC